MRLVSSRRQIDDASMAQTDLAGEMLRSDTPEWKPLLDLAPDRIDDFMWMFEVELETGTRLHAYKHRWTRRYLHLACDGRAFAYCGDSRYREVGPRRMLQLAIDRPPPCRE
jgi:hypothetical protein